MNDRFKFRAWHKENKKMDKNFLNLTENFCVSVKKIAHTEGYVIMQYTGLHDNCGKCIYEGDIVYIAGVGNVEVKFENGSFQFNTEFYHEVIEDLGGVIGNIYENPDIKIAP